jgi:hypothetical protein
MQQDDKHSINYYVKNIFYVLKTGIPDKALICKYHYSSIYKIYIGLTVIYLIIFIYILRRGNFFINYSYKKEVFII